MLYLTGIHDAGQLPRFDPSTWVGIRRRIAIDLIDDIEAQPDIAVVSRPASGPEGLEQVRYRIESNRLSAIADLENDHMIVQLLQIHNHRRGSVSMLKRVGDQIGDHLVKTLPVPGAAEITLRAQDNVARRI